MKNKIMWNFRAMEITWRCVGNKVGYPRNSSGICLWLEGRRTEPIASSWFSGKVAPDLMIVNILKGNEIGQTNSFYDIKYFGPVTIELRFHFPPPCSRKVRETSRTLKFLWVFFQWFFVVLLIWNLDLYVTKGCNLKDYVVQNLACEKLPQFFTNIWFGIFCVWFFTK